MAHDPGASLPTRAPLTTGLGRLRPIRTAEEAASVAQAEVEELVLVTRDPVFARHGAAVIGA